MFAHMRVYTVPYGTLGTLITALKSAMCGTLARGALEAISSLKLKQPTDIFFWYF